MSEAVALQPLKAFRLPTQRRTAVLLGGVPRGQQWLAIASRLEMIAREIGLRFDGCSEFDQALAGFIAHEIRGVASEIRANLALEEMTACQNLS